MNTQSQAEKTQDQLLDQHLNAIKGKYPTLFATEAGRAEVKELVRTTLNAAYADTREIVAENVLENMKALVQQDLDAFKDDGLSPEVLDAMAKDPTGTATILIAQSHRLILAGLEMVLFNDVEIGDEPADCHDPDCKVHHDSGEDDLLLYGKARGEA